MKGREMNSQTSAKRTNAQTQPNQTNRWPKAQRKACTGNAFDVLLNSLDSPQLALRNDRIFVGHIISSVILKPFPWIPFFPEKVKTEKTKEKGIRNAEENSMNEICCLRRWNLVWPDDWFLYSWGFVNWQRSLDQSESAHDRTPLNS